MQVEKQVIESKNMFPLTQNHRYLYNEKGYIFFLEMRDFYAEKL